MPKPKLSVLNISLASGGAEKVISLLLKEFVKDYEVTLFLFYREIHFPIPPEVKVQVFKESPPTMGSPIRKIWDLLIFIRKYLTQVRAFEIKYAISFLAWPNLLNGILASTNPKVKTIISERGFPSDNTTSKLSFWISKIFYPLLYNRCDKLFSNSRFINQDLRENFGIKIPMAVIYNPIAPPNLDVDYKIFSASPVKLISVGSIIPRKNHSMIIEAVRELNSPYHLTIIGEGPLRTELKATIKNDGLSSHISLPGKTSQVYSHLMNSDIFILSSHTEGFPNALLEAMSAGLPCISTNCLSGPLELLNDGDPIEIPKGGYVQGKFGILINNNDSIGLLNAIRLFIENPATAHTYSQLSKQRSKDFELSSIYSQLKEFIQK